MSNRDQINRSWHRRAHQPLSPAQRAADRWTAAQTWSQVTGRPLPPSMREREAASPAVPMSQADRQRNYVRQGKARNTTTQLGRLRRKRNHQAAVRRKRRAAA